MSDTTPTFAYFGGEPLAVPVLECLKAEGLVPSLIVCNPDRPTGRKQSVTPPPAKVWAKENGVEVFQPDSCKVKTELTPLTERNFDVFVVVAYNQILPTWLIETPPHKTINLHPSLLPSLRGASPIRSAILTDSRATGVTVIELDAKMDHGPILAQEVVEIPEISWPIDGRELDTLLAEAGGKLLAKTIPAWVKGDIVPKQQNHERATYCGKITKDMAELPINPLELPEGKEAYDLFLKIQAFAGWPVAFFRHENRRYKITVAKLTPEGKLQIEKIIPEGKNEVPFATHF